MSEKQNTTRLHDWMPRLQAAIEARLHARFVIGEHDCCLFSCDIVEAVCGYDPAHGLRGTYSSEDAAQAIIDARGGLDVLAGESFGAAIAPGLAAAGDVGMIETERGPALVSCMGGHWLAAGAFGLVMVSNDDVIAAWRCERMAP